MTLKADISPQIKDGATVSCDTGIKIVLSQLVALEFLVMVHL